jgi:hypothetical protein
MRSIQRGISALFLVVTVLVIATAVTISYFTFYLDAKKTKQASVTSFEDCAKLYPVIESYPEQCNTPDGKHFTRQLSEEEKQRTVSHLESVLSMGESSDWKTFTNDIYKFSYQYPGTWIFEETKNTNELLKHEFIVKDRALTEVIVVITKDKGYFEGLSEPILSKKSYNGGMLTIYETAFDGVAGTKFTKRAVIKKGDLYYVFLLRSLMDNKEEVREIFNNFMDRVVID